jgi:transposase
VQRDLKATGGMVRVRLFVPCADAHVVKKRKDFARYWASQPVSRVSLIVFSDEHMVSVNDFSCRTMYLWDKSDLLFRLRMRDQNVPRVHIWGAIGVGFRGPLVIFPRTEPAEDPSHGKPAEKAFRVTADAYSRRCLTVLNRERGIRHRIFMQDNARIHTAKSTQRKLDDMGWNLMQNWPPYSPDLNPIENLWAVLNRRVSELRPKSQEDLEEAVRKVWNTFPQAEIDNFCLSFVNKIKNCVKNNGNPGKK